MGDTNSIAALIDPTTVSLDMMSGMGMSMVLIFGTLSTSYGNFAHIVICAAVWLMFSVGCSGFIMHRKDA